MEPSKEAIAVRITRLNRQILGKVTSGSNKLNKKTIDREALLDALTVLYDECNDDPVKKTDELVRTFVDKYRSTLAELRRTRVCLSDFEILQTIGRGHFGEVHMVREKETGDVYAMKTLRKEQARKRAVGATEDERDILASANNPWIPRLQYAFQDSSSLYLVMELCSGGDLAALLARRAAPLPEPDAAFYVCEAAHALNALHGMGYVHRDVKPHNIFLDRCGHVKLGDFGSCARLAEGGGGAPAAGTADYMAPELLAAADCARRHSVCHQYCASVVTNAISACDYWSLGVVAFELVTLKRPFSSGDEDSITQILANIQKYEREAESGEASLLLSDLEGASEAWRALVGALLRVPPSRRASYLDTLQHCARARPLRATHLRAIRDQVLYSVGSGNVVCGIRYEAESGEASVLLSDLEGASEAWRALVGALLRVPPSRRASYLDTLQHCARARPLRATHLRAIRDQVLYSVGSGNVVCGIRYEAESGEASVLLSDLEGASEAWRALVGALLRVPPSRRASYLDTLQHCARARPLRATHLRAIRDQAPPWVPMVRGAEDGAWLGAAPRAPPPPSAAPFRARQPFAGQLPFIGFSYVAPEDNEDSSTASLGFNASHDCTAIDLATFKSAEKLAAMRGREVASLQERLAAAEAAAGAAAGAARRDADDDHERTRARLQGEITALSLQNRRLERQVEVEKEERMALQRTNQELATGIADRANAELRDARAQAAALSSERDQLREDLRRLEARVSELQAECARAVSAADAARAQQQHYKDSVAKERALRRQTLSGSETESREMASRLAALEASLARQTRAREQAERRLADLDDEHGALRADRAALQAELDAAKATGGESQRSAALWEEQLRQAQQQLAQERVKNTALAAQVQEAQRSLEEAARREAALEEQSARTEARLAERLAAADARATAALADDARHREKVNTLEQLVRQLEREVGALENRTCSGCAARDAVADRGADSHSDTESVADAAHAQLALLKEQLERAETQLQTRAEEIANLRQEARSANLARWRKEREYNDLSVEAKSTARDLKRLEERLAHASEARKSAEQKATTLQAEISTLAPQHQQAKEEAERLKDQLERLRKVHETAQAEVDRSRNDIRKLKSELQYSEKRRMHAEEQEELSSRERAQLRDELQQLRAANTDLVQNNKALQEACGLLEEQLTDLEKLADIHEIKNKDLESESQRLRSELETCRTRLQEAERQASERGAAASLAAQHHDEARETARHAHCQLQLLRERLENREARVAELEGRVASLEGSTSATEAALSAAMRRVRELQEESSALRTRAHDHHAHALQLQAALADAQEELSAAREAAEAAAAWWRTRETKADATLRQQAKLIDFLQAKVEEAGRKKCSLSNKLFGRSGRRSAASPPLRRVNRELREEVERLRAQLASRNGDLEYPPTPRREKPKTIIVRKSIDMPDGPQDNNTVQIVWSDGVRERQSVRWAEGALALAGAGGVLRARLLAPDARDLPQNEANRAFTIKLEGPARCERAAIVCGSIEERNAWVSLCAREAAAAAPSGYAPRALCSVPAEPRAAVQIAPDAVAIGCADGLHSLRGPLRLEGVGSAQAVSSPALCAERLVVAGSGGAGAAGRDAAGSALRRAAALRPALRLEPVALPADVPPQLVKAIIGEPNETGACAAVACGRRVFVIRRAAAAGAWRAIRSLTADRAPAALLLTPRALYVCGERTLRLPLPSGALEPFAADEPVVAAAARKHSPPCAILLINDNPTEILICYAECGVFVDEAGRRTRSEEPKWSAAARAWEFVAPFLYVVGSARISVLLLTPDAFRAPPCTCAPDAASLASASTGSDCCQPQVYNLPIEDPILLGTAPTGIIIGTKIDDGYRVSLVEGLAAFRSVGASIESLETIADSKGSSLDLAQSLTDLSPPAQDVSQESVEATTGFLADIRKRARQLRNKHKKERTPDDVIKEILTTEVGLKRPSGGGRRSPATISEFDSDSTTESEDPTESTRGTNDLCAEMFARQVRFQ